MMRKYNPWDIFCAALGLATFAAFTGFLAVRVPDAPLLAIVVGVILLAAIDFARRLRAPDNGAN